MQYRLVDFSNALPLGNADQSANQSVTSRVGGIIKDPSTGSLAVFSSHLHPSVEVLHVRVLPSGMILVCIYSPTVMHSEFYIFEDDRQVEAFKVLKGRVLDVHVYELSGPRVGKEATVVFTALTSLGSITTFPVTGGEALLKGSCKEVREMKFGLDSKYLVRGNCFGNVAVSFDRGVVLCRME